MTPRAGADVGATQPATGVAWRLPLEWETYERPDGLHQRRMVLRSKETVTRWAHPRDRVPYSGLDFWPEETWRAIEALLAIQNPDEAVREEIRQAVFWYVQGTTPLEGDRLHYVQWGNVRGTLEAIGKAAEQTLLLHDLLDDGYCNDQRERGERWRARAFLADAQATWEPCPSDPSIREQRGYNTFQRDLMELATVLAEHRTLLTRIVEYVPKALTGVPESKRGPKSDEWLAALVANLIKLVEGQLGPGSATLSLIDETIGGTLGELAKLIQPHLPKVHGRMGSKSSEKALYQALRRARAGSAIPYPRRSSSRFRRPKTSRT